MRIQETDRILKDARSLRRAAVPEPEEKGISRVWHAITRVFKRDKD